MVDVTLLEVHLDGAEFTANAPSSTTGSSDGDGEGTSGLLARTDDEDDESAGGAGDGGGGLLRVVLALAALVAVVLALRRLVGGEPEPLPE